MLPQNMLLLCLRERAIEMRPPTFHTARHLRTSLRTCSATLLPQETMAKTCETICKMPYIFIQSIKNLKIFHFSLYMLLMNF